MPEAPNISVCICTYNRSASLARTLESMQRLQKLDGDQLEIVVCQNNCTDNTAEVIDNFRSRMPIKAISETRQGLSHARNAAIAQSAGDLILFTDDDVRVSPDLLSLYGRASREHPEASFFGGPIIPLHVLPPPRWLTPEAQAMLAGVLVTFTLGDSDRPIDAANALPWGANMAFRRGVLQGRQFDPNLGVQGKKHLVGEETDMMERLLADGHKGWYIASAVVEHEVDVRRLTARYIHHHAWNVGRTMARRNESGGARANLWQVRVALGGLGSFVAGRIAGDAPKWIAGLRASGLYFGRFWENVTRRTPTQ